MGPALGKTQCLIHHHIPIVPPSSGDLRALPTQPQEAEPLLETEGGNTEGRAPGLGGETQPCSWGHRGRTQAHRTQLSQRV